MLRRLSKDCLDRPNILKELSNANFESYLLESLLGSTSRYQTEFSQHKLAIDPMTNQMALDFTNLVRNVLGHKEGGVSPNKYVARDECIERELL